MFAHDKLGSAWEAEGAAREAGLFFIERIPGCRSISPDFHVGAIKQRMEYSRWKFYVTRLRLEAALCIPNSDPLAVPLLRAVPAGYFSVVD